MATPLIPCAPTNLKQTAMPWGQSVRRTSLTTLQLNLGRLCNLACTHCHIEAGPKRTEMLTDYARAKIIDWMNRYRPRTVDLTGGAPEMIPGFRELVIAARAIGADVIDRCNLAVLQEPGQDDLAAFLAEQRVHVVASLPCYLAENVDKQRGHGTWDRSILGLKALNVVGIGIREELPLHLVFNPTGAGLPPSQKDLEPEYRRRLWADWGIAFTGLWCLANVPIKRFRRFLQQTGRLEAYEQRLRDSYNPATLDGLMCRTTISVDHEGRVYDCDFNLAEDIPLGNSPSHRYLWEIAPDRLPGGLVAMRPHCLACTAGCGSSCTGSVAAPPSVREAT